MTEQTRPGLRKLQRLDKEIREARTFLAEFDPLLAEVEEPALKLGAEVERTRSRLQEMRLEERRLEGTSREKRTRIEKLEERLQGVRNVREETAVNAELEMVRAALDSDDQEAFSLLDQIRRFELRLEEETSAHEAAVAELEPKRKDLVVKRDAAQSGLAGMEAERASFAATIDPVELRTYDAIHGGGRRRALAPLTEDGACGSCFSMIPLQLQQEIRDGGSLVRCEGCGVILAAPDEDDLATEQAREEAAQASDAEEASADVEESEGTDAESSDEETPEA